MDSARVLLTGNHADSGLQRIGEAWLFSQEVIPLDADTHHLARTDRQQGEREEESGFAYSHASLLTILSVCQVEFRPTPTLPSLMGQVSFEIFTITLPESCL